MAPADGSRKANGLANGASRVDGPSPTSALSSRLVPGNKYGTSDFNRASFKQLLDESLGYDEEGQPNLGANLEVNHKLIYVVVKAGIDSLFDLQEDPFQAKGIGRDSSQLISCLDVIRLAIERSPEVLFVISNSKELGSDDDQIPLFVWLIPKILRVFTLCKGSDDELHIRLNEFLAIFLGVDTKCTPLQTTCTTVWDFLACCVEGVLDQLRKVEDPLSLTKTIFLNGDESKFRNDLPRLQLGVLRLSSRFPLGNVSQSLRIISRILSALARQDREQNCLPKARETKKSFQIIDQLESFWFLLCSTIVEQEWPLVLEYFEILEMLLKTLATGLSGWLDRKLSSLWSAALVDCFTTLSDGEDFELMRQMDPILSNSISLTQLAPSLRSSILESLGPILGALPETCVIGVKDFIERLICQPDNFGNARNEANVAISHTAEKDIKSGGERARKRLRLSIEEPATKELTNKEQICQKLTMMFSGKEVPDLVGLNRTATTHFQKLSEVDKCVALDFMGLAACFLSNECSTTNSLALQEECPACDLNDFRNRHKSVMTSDLAEELLKALLALAPFISRSSKGRVSATLTLRRILIHTSLPEQLELTQSATGDWVLQCLRSSSRDIRLAGTMALQPFVMDNKTLDSAVVHNNRVVALDFLQHLWAKNEATMQEAVVVALTTMARVVGDEELNIILIRLVEYLGETNPYINGLVYAELQNLAESLQMPVGKLLRPFWRTISVVVIKNFHTRPIIAQQLCDLLGMHINGLLIRIEEFALPYLVYTRRRDVVERVAAAHDPPSTPFIICTQKGVLINILSYLLAQSPAAPETIMAQLIYISEEFRLHGLAQWVAHEPIMVACELLKAIVDAGEGHGSRTYQALQLLAQLTITKPGHSVSSRKGDHLGEFFETYALAISNHFTISLNMDETKEPRLEKRRCLAAIGEIVRLGKSRVLAALPQMCACLRSTMENKYFCDTAFASWVVMMKSLKEEEVEALVDQTFAIIVRNWSIFNSVSKQLAHSLVSELLKKHATVTSTIFDIIPSLSSLPELTNQESEFEQLKNSIDERRQFIAFIKRLKNENLEVIEEALGELLALMESRFDYLNRSIFREQPDPFVADLTRALLDCSVRFNESPEIPTLCGRCLAYIGCLDPSKIETVREKKSIIALSNFGRADECMDFIMFFLEHVLFKCFRSASSLRSQGFLAWAMQELLKICSLDQSIALRSRSTAMNSIDKRWAELPENVRNTLIPFLSSRYIVNEPRTPEACKYPLFQAGKMTHSEWLRRIVLDFLNRAASGNVQLVFSVCCRIVTGQDVAIPSFLLPFAVLNAVISGIEEDKREITQEMLSILRQPLSGDGQTQEDIKLCSESVFDILDYMLKWLQLKRKHLSIAMARLQRGVDDHSIENALAQVQSVEQVLESIPPDLMSQRAVDCRSYARALFNWENYIRQSRQGNAESDVLLKRLQDIYAGIDEPDGIEGISSQLQVLDINQQVLEHRNAGHWTAAQSWYEMQFIERPNDPEIQTNLMNCLKQSGQYEVLLHHFDGLENRSSQLQTLPFAVEAAWACNRWDKLATYLNLESAGSGDFNISIARVLRSLHAKDLTNVNTILDELDSSLIGGFTLNSISSIQACHDTLLKAHLLFDIRMASKTDDSNRARTLEVLNRRLDVLGSYVADKQYVLGIRRAVMALNSSFTDQDIASTWLASARLARKAHSLNHAFNSVLHASTLGENSATLEQAKLMWQEGDHRKAIQTLEGAIEFDIFRSHDTVSEDDPGTVLTDQAQNQNLVKAKAFVLLGKWLDSAGQTQSEVIIKTFRKAIEQHRNWEKSFYYLGKHYNKILDSERVKPPGKESQTYLTGDTARLVIHNYLRSVSCGSKYVFQTLPKILTLWMELIKESDQPRDVRQGNEKFHAHNAAQRKKIIKETNSQLEKFIERIQPVALYTILPQVVARICDSNQSIRDILDRIVVRVVRAFPQQALWTLLAVIKSQSKDRASRGISIVTKLVDKQNQTKDISPTEFRNLIHSGQKLSDEVLRVSEYPIEGKASKVSLRADLGFNHKIAPSRLVVPVEGCLIPSLPTNHEAATLKLFRPFSKEPVTITAFLDEALVLASLQKPRKLSIRGSDGNIYGVLAKPKDDLRKDQRLMEFNTMINRFLKRDVEASKRRLYIRTYAVTPLNEECGLIEWVDNLKTFRDIVLKHYKERNVTINYNEIRTLLDQACSAPDKSHIFTDSVLKAFPPVFHEWFVETFPDNSGWFNARLRYTRSCAVMSIVGHVLGLGDRHGENILFEEDNGGTMHVDFNCLFDKGLTFEKPECVPFRLTHNMVDAFGAYKYNGPFRRCSEITLSLLRAHEDSLMTILETFLHDPTQDFISVAKRKKAGIQGLPDTAVGVLDVVRAKVRGMLAGESVPLNVGGYVEEMIKQATDPANLCKMYIGWCAFF